MDSTSQPLDCQVLKSLELLALKDAFFYNFPQAETIESQLLDLRILISHSCDKLAPFPALTKLEHLVLHDCLMLTPYLPKKHVPPGHGLIVPANSHSVESLPANVGVTDSEEWLILLASLVVEGLSAVFEQLDYDLLGFQMAVFGLFICVAEILYRARVEQVSVEWVGKLPFLYSHYPTHKRFGTTVHYFGLLAAVWQCFHASFGYFYALKNSENPIKMTLTMFLFCLCLIVSKVVNKYSTRPLSGAHTA